MQSVAKRSLHRTKQFSTVEYRGILVWQPQRCLGLKKSLKKLSETFQAHCVDSWCLAYHTVGGERIVENTDLICISPIAIIYNEILRITKIGEIQKIRWGVYALPKKE